ncbi:MAG: DUF465 domain-containing protein [Pyrinomonadaceae bacterium]
MDISTTEAVKEELIKESQTFRDLVEQHESYETRLVQLANLTYPNEEEQLEEIAIKKKKLTIKDEIYSMINDYSKSQ